jgi:hypothetical protein
MFARHEARATPDDRRVRAIVIACLMSPALTYAEPVRIAFVADAGRMACGCTQPAEWAGGELAVELAEGNYFSMGGALGLNRYWETSDEFPGSGGLGTLLFTAGPDYADPAAPWLHLALRFHLGLIGIYETPQTKGELSLGPAFGATAAVDLGTRDRLRVQVSIDNIYVVSAGLGYVLAHW